MWRKQIGLIILVAIKNMSHLSSQLINRMNEWGRAAALHNKIGIHSKSDAIPHSPLDRFCTVHHLLIHWCFGGGCRSPGSPQSPSITDEHNRFVFVGHCLLCLCSCQRAAHIPTHFNIPMMSFFVIRYFQWPMFIGRDTTQQFTNDSGANWREMIRF